VGSSHLQVPLDGDGALTLGQQHDDEIALAQLGVPGFLSPSRKGSTYLAGD
jgi:hypothetical protein